jgi:hypothetical protein
MAGKVSSVNVITTDVTLIDVAVYQPRSSRAPGGLLVFTALCCAPGVSYHSHCSNRIGYTAAWQRNRMPTTPVVQTYGRSSITIAQLLPMVTDLARPHNKQRFHLLTGMQHSSCDSSHLLHYNTKQESKLDASQQLCQVGYQATQHPF